MKTAFLISQLEAKKANRSFMFVDLISIKNSRKGKIHRLVS